MALTLTLKDFQNGELPDAFIEKERIVDVRDGASVAFQQDMQRITDRLLKEKATEFRFLVSDDDTPNAFVISGAQPPIICYTRGLLAKMEYEDELAASDAHELTHKQLFDKLGLHDNSKPEEMGADLWPIKALQEAGYAPIAIEMVMQKLPNDPNRVSNASSYIDVHPGNEMRVRLIENGRAAHRSMTGKENKELTPINSVVIGAVSGLKHVGHIEKVLGQAGYYDEPDVLRRMDILYEAIDKQALEFEPRGTDLAKELSTLSFDANNPEHLEKFTAIVDRITAPSKDINWQNGSVEQSNRNTQKLYESSNTAWRNAPGSRGMLPGNIKKIEEAAQAFVRATTREEASAAALQMLDYKRRIREGALGDGNDTNRTLYNVSAGFELPSRYEVQSLDDEIRNSPPEAVSAIIAQKGLKLPYADHLDWAIEDQKNGGGPEIVYGLKMMGVESDRYPFMHSSSHKKTVATSTDRAPYQPAVLMDNETYWAEMRKGWDDNRGNVLHSLEESQAIAGVTHRSNEQHLDQGYVYELKYVRFDETGRMYGFKSGGRETHRGVEYEKYRQREESRIKGIDAEQSVAVKTANWSLLEGSFEQFAEFHKRYREYLVPEKTIVDGGDTFARAYIEKITAVLAEDSKLPDFDSNNYDAPHNKGVKDWVRDFLIKGENDYIRPHSLVALQKEYVDINKHTGAQVESRSLDLLDDRGKKVTIPQGISPNHPYVQFALDNRFNVFEPYERLAFVGSSRYLNSLDTTLPIAERWALDPQKVLGQGNIDNPEQLLDWYNALTQKEKDGFSRAITDFRAFGTDGGSREIMLVDIVQTQTAGTLEKSGAGLTIDQLYSMGKVNRYSIISNFFPDVNRTLQDQAKAIAENMVKDGTALDEQIRAYQVLKVSSLLTNHPQQKNALEESIVKKIESFDRWEDALPAAREMLFNNEIYNPKTPDLISSGYSADIRNPDRRDRLVKVLANSYAARLGKDDGTPKYIERAKFAVDYIMRNTSGSIRYQLISSLADATESQRELSYYMRDAVTDCSIRELAKEGDIVSAGELSVDRINQNDEMRFSTLEFLRNPASDEAIKNYCNIVEKHFGNGVLLTNREAQELRKAKQIVDDKVVISDAVKHSILRDYHQNFNALPLEGKSIYTDLILFPPNKTHENILSSSTTQYVLDAMLPAQGYAPEPESLGRTIKEALHLKKRQGPPANIVGRDMVEAFLKVSEPGDQRLLLAAMLVSNDPSETEGSNLGRSLKRILYAMEPAGTKIAQSIHSHRDTPKDIKDEMAEAKIMANKPPRWTMFEIMDETLPPPAFESELPAGTVLGPVHGHLIRRTGKTLGAGSYGITMEVERVDGSFTAITLLRPNAHARAEYGFERFEKAAELLLEKHPQLAPIIDMIEQAHRMSAIETDMDIAAKQHGHASSNYDGLTVKVDDVLCHFGAAPWMRHGQNREKGLGFKETAVVEGVHFQELPGYTPNELAELKGPPIYTAEQTELKCKIAKAIATSELLMLAQGKTFDHDRHGGQQRIVINYDKNPVEIFIGNFDFGAMSLEPPTKEEKQAFAKVMVDTFGAYAFSKVTSQKDIGELFSGQIARYKDQPELLNHLASIERGMLATSGMLEYLTPKDRTEIFANVLFSNQVDPELKSALKQQLPLIYPLIEHNMKKKQTDDLSFAYEQDTQMVLKQPKKQSTVATTTSSTPSPKIPPPAPPRENSAHKSDLVVAGASLRSSGVKGHDGAAQAYTSAGTQSVTIPLKVKGKPVGEIKVGFCKDTLQSISDAKRAITNSVSGTQTFAPSDLTGAKSR